jgi:hypothetical protein
VSNAQIALAWLLKQPGITTPIVSAGKIFHTLCIRCRHMTERNLVSEQRLSR